MNIRTTAALVAALSALAGCTEQEQGKANPTTPSKAADVSPRPTA